MPRVLEMRKVQEIPQRCLLITRDGDASHDSVIPSGLSYPSGGCEPGGPWEKRHRRTSGQLSPPPWAPTAEGSSDRRPRRISPRSARRIAPDRGCPATDGRTLAASCAIAAAARSMSSAPSTVLLTRSARHATAGMSRHQCVNSASSMVPLLSVSKDWGGDGGKKGEGGKEGTGVE